jgi:tetratricopeptide (TPR) repeat protein
MQLQRAIFACARMEEHYAACTLLLCWANDVLQPFHLREVWGGAVSKFCAKMKFAVARVARRVCARGLDLRESSITLALFSLVVFVTLASATPSFAQGRCAQPVARVVEAQGIVAVGPASGLIPVAAGNQADVCQGDSIQAGARSRAAVLLFASNQTIRVNQNTTLVILPEMPGGQRTLIDLVRGFIRLINPIGRGLDVRTPYVTAGTEGTEFFVAYDPDTLDTTAGVIEGVVRVATMSESLRVSPGEVVRARQAGPLQRLNIQPNDAVRWAIFYPAASYSLSPTEETALDPNVKTAWDAWRMGNLAGFAQALNAIPPAATLNAPSLLRFAALLLVVGQVDEATEAINRADTLYSRASLGPAFRPAAAVTGAAGAGCRSLGQDWTLIPALRAIIAVARNETADALAQSECAIAAAAGANDASATIAAVIARSYALQSAFRLQEARDVLATVVSSNDPLVFARLAELDLSLGDNGAARREAMRAAEIAPNLSLTSSILGFSALAGFDFSGARTAFARAASLDPGDPLPHLGLGLVAIRAGNLEDGRSELVIAATLDPENAVARSYLGRTYANLRLYDDAFREWSLAETADPNDPTAPLYRAFALRALNRPAEALKEIEKSIALNGNRAVYRSRLLVHQDLATRTGDLAAVYRDLGFDRLALSEGYKSVSDDPANPGAHRFLSENYLAMPRHETASDSELLQSLLLQPLNVQPLRPRLAREGLGIVELQGPFRIGFNEFSPLFASDGLNVLADVFGGTLGTYGDNLAVTGVLGKFSLGLGQFYSYTDGFRPNDQFRRDSEDALAQVALSDSVSLLAEYRHSGFHAGDTALFFDRTTFTATGLDNQDRWQYRVGARADVAAGVTVVGVWTQGRLTELTDSGGPYGFAVDGTQVGHLGEAQVYFSRPRLNVVAGGGYFYGNDKATGTLHDPVYGDFSFPLPGGDTSHGNGWIYATDSHIENVHLTLGASYSSYRSGLIDRDQLSPKLGISWDILPGSTLRGAYFEGLKRTTVGGQTIEPTQIAGFDQLFEDVDGSKAKRWGVGFDQKLGDNLFGGVEWSQRRLSVPIAFGSAVALQNWKEDVAAAYLSWIAIDRLAVNFGPQWERFVRDPSGINDLSFADLDLFRLPLELRYFDPSGLFALVRGTLVYETGHFLHTDTFTIFGGRETFGVVDAGIGWRLPGRGVIGTLEVTNLLNAGFRFQDTDPNNPTIIPHRVVMGRITVTF